MNEFTYIHDTSLKMKVQFQKRERETRWTLGSTPVSKPSSTRWTGGGRGTTRDNLNAKRM